MKKTFTTSTPRGATESPASSFFEKKISTVILDIEKVVYRGLGLARLDGRVVFIKNVIPGERVAAKITRSRKNYLEAELIEIIKPSPSRIPTRYSNSLSRSDITASNVQTYIPSIVYEHILYETEVDIKQSQLTEFFSDILRQEDLASFFLPPVGSPLNLNYRNKITLHAGRGSNGEIILGYYGDDNKTIIDIPDCPLARMPINNALTGFRSSPMFRRLRPGNKVVFRWTPDNGVVYGHSQPPLITQLTETFTYGNLKVPYDAFYQVNPEVADLLVKQIVSWFLSSSDEIDNVVDLYCGVGCFGLACAINGAKKVIGIESVNAAIQCARDNAKSLNVIADFYCQTAALGFKNIAEKINLPKTMVIVDPPRSGLEPELTQMLSTTKATYLVYVSCDPATLSRDLKRLIHAGYRIKVARMFDMFPRTFHFETAVLLTSN